MPSAPPTHLYHLDFSLRSAPFKMTKQNAPHFVILSACEVSRSLNCQPPADRILSLRVKRGNPGHQMPSAPPTHLYHLDSSLSFKMTPSPSCCAIHPSLHHPKNSNKFFGSRLEGNYRAYQFPSYGGGGPPKAVGRVQTKHIVFCHTERMRSIQVWQIKKFSRHFVSNTNSPGFFTIVQNDNMKQNALHFVILSACEVSRSLNCQPPADHILSLRVKRGNPGHQKPSARRHIFITWILHYRSE
jgi:hypothetical protein